MRKSYLRCVSNTSEHFRSYARFVTLASDLSSVPAEILARGPKAVQAFQKALSEGKTRVRRVPVMLIGQERAGKTSLLKSLKGETFDPREESTRGIAIDPRHCKVTQEIWKPGRNDDGDVATAVSFEHRLATAAHKNLVGSQEPLDSGTLHGEEKDVDLDSDDGDTRELKEYEDSWEFLQEPAEVVVQRDYPAKLPPTKNTASSSDTLSNNESKVPEEIAALIEELIRKKDLEDDSDIYCTLWDFAGQSVFYATHSLFLSHRAIYLLVNDLSKGPDQEADPLRKQGRYRRYDETNLLKTNLDFLHFWLTSIASLGNESIASEVYSGNLPPVIFVGTHADKFCGDASATDSAREVFGSLRQKSYSSHLVGDFFVVDNTRSGSGEEDKEVPRLREKILALCRELQKSQVDFPLRWLMFEKTLQAALQKGYNSMKVSETKIVATNVCGITDQNEFRAVLEFLHDQSRILVHLEDSAELEGLVVLNPQWLVDILKEVITVKPFESGQSASEEHWKEHWKELEESGVLKRDLLEHVWRHLLHQRNTIEALVSIMEKFNLICRWPSSTSTEEYLVPLMLKSLPVSKKLTELLSSAVVPSLFIRFPCVQTPQVCFPYLLVSLINEWTKKQPACFQRPKLHRNFVRLSLNPSDDSSLVLFCHNDVIEVALCTPTTPSGCFLETTCYRVVRVLEDVLQQMRKGCYWLKAKSYELCFRCPVCCAGAQQVTSCGTQDLAHFIPYRELREGRQPIRCDRSEVAMDRTVQIHMFAPWLGENSAEYGTDGVHAEVAIPMPNDVESILQTADQTAIITVQRAIEHLQLDKTALDQPSADTRQKVRGLANQMKRCNRADAVRHLRTLVPAGTTGPLSDERLAVFMMPPKEMRELTVFLSGRKQWKDVAVKLGLSNDEILFLDERTRNPAEGMLVEMKRKNPNFTVGDLYDVLVEIDMAVAADIM